MESLCLNLYYGNSILKNTVSTPKIAGDDNGIKFRSGQGSFWADSEVLQECAMHYLKERF
jgi:hypothetical protein